MRVHTHTQCDELLRHLKEGYTLTQRSALLDYGVMSLSRRICDLKARGIKISRKLENNVSTGQRYARYQLEPDN